MVNHTWDSRCTCEAACEGVVPQTYTQPSEIGCFCEMRCRVRRQLTSTRERLSGSGSSSAAIARAAAGSTIHNNQKLAASGYIMAG